MHCMQKTVCHHAPIDSVRVKHKFSTEGRLSEVEGWKKMCFLSW